MAGSWTTIGVDRGNANVLGIYAIQSTFTADAANGSVPNLTIPCSAAKLLGYGIKFGTPAPNTVTITLTDTDGVYQRKDERSIY